MEYTNPADIKTAEPGGEQTTVQLGLTDDTGERVTVIDEFEWEKGR